MAQYDINNLDLNLLKTKENVEIIKATAKAIKGQFTPERLVIDENGKTRELNVDGVFVVAGNKPNTEALVGKVDLTEEGFIVCDENMHTSETGVFACGDVRKSKLKQVATAVGDGALAGVEASIFVTKNQ